MPDAPAPPDRYSDSYTYDSWVNDPARPTVVLDVPGVGPVNLCTKKANQVEALKRGEASFSPLEVKRLFVTHDKGSLTTEGAQKLALLKKHFPGATVRGVVDADGWVLFPDEKPLPSQNKLARDGKIVEAIGFGDGVLGRHREQASEAYHTVAHYDALKVSAAAAAASKEPK